MPASGHGGADRFQQVQVGATQAAIAGDGRDREPAHAGLRERLGQRQDLGAARVGDPAIADGTAVAHVERGHDAIGAVALDEHPAQPGPADERAAEDDAVGAGSQGLGDLVRVTDAAGDLARHPDRS